MHSPRQTHWEQHMAFSALRWCTMWSDTCTAWCHEIDSLTSLNAPELHASSDVREPIDLLPNYGPDTSKRYRKPVTTDNTVISNCEKRNFRRSSDLAGAKIYLFAVLVIFDMPSTNHFFWSFCSQVGVTMVLEGVFWGVCFRTVSAVVSRFWQRFRRLGPLKIGLVILGNLRKC